MSELIKAYDSYNDFEYNAYFTLRYDKIPSSLVLKINLKANKENMDKVREVLDLDETEFKVCYKEWSVKGKNKDFSKDYVHSWLFESSTQNCLIWVSMEHERLTIDFQYDCQDLKLEEWILEKNRAIRLAFTTEKQPSFKVLVREHGSFDTEDVQTDRVALNVEQNYNDDFLAVHNQIIEGLSSKKSGMILLHGTPGTGKTTYIKSLISNHEDLNFIFVQNDFVRNLLDPEFITFLLQQRNSILVIEDAEKVIMSREQQNEDSVVSTILQLTDGLFSDYLNIKFICTFNTNLSKVDTALMRKGRMIAMHEFKALNVDKANILLSDRGIDPENKEMTLADIYNYDEELHANVKKTTLGFK